MKRAQHFLPFYGTVQFKACNKAPAPDKQEAKNAINDPQLLFVHTAKLMR